MASYFISKAILKSKEVRYRAVITQSGRNMILGYVICETTRATIVIFELSLWFLCLFSFVGAKKDG